MATSIPVSGNLANLPPNYAQSAAMEMGLGGRRKTFVFCCDLKTALMVVGSLEIIINVLSAVRIFTNYFVILSQTTSVALIVIVISFACIMLWSVHNSRACGIIPMLVLEYVTMLFLVARMAVFTYSLFLSELDPRSAGPTVQSPMVISWFYLLAGSELVWKIFVLFALHKGYSLLKTRMGLVAPYSSEMRSVAVIYPHYPLNGSLRCTHFPFVTANCGETLPPVEDFDDGNNSGAYRTRPPPYFGPEPFMISPPPPYIPPAPIASGMTPTPVTGGQQLPPLNEPPKIST